MEFMVKSMNKSHLYGLVFASSVMFGFVTPSNAVVIDFESLPTGLLSTNQIVYDEAIFTSSDRFYVTSSLSNRKLCPYNGNCEENITVDFTHAVNNLTFETSVYNPGDELTVYVYGADGLLGSRIYTVNALVDLSTFANVTSIEILYTGGGGNGYNYDNFRFDIATTFTDVYRPIGPFPTSRHSLPKA